VVSVNSLVSTLSSSVIVVSVSFSVSISLNPFIEKLGSSNNISERDVLSFFLILFLPIFKKSVGDNVPPVKICNAFFVLNKKTHTFF
jgi:hypothetical protein